MSIGALGSRRLHIEHDAGKRKLGGEGKPESSNCDIVDRLRSPQARNCLLGLLLAIATIFAYQQAWNAGYIWDDDFYVTDNELLHAPDGLRRIWFSQDSPSQYFPLTYTSLRIEYALWGLNSSGYHWTNILLHVINALLLWLVLARLKLPGPWLAAAIFALHPVHVESVAWITERKNTLSLFFMLLSTHAWLAFAEERPKTLWRYYALALLLYALALFSKTTACTLPATLILVLWLKEKPINWRRWVQVIPFLILGVAMGLFTMWWERHHQHTTGKDFGYGMLDRLLIASRAAWFYIGKLIWPRNLTFSYPHWTIDPSDPLAYSWLAACIALGAAVAYVRRFFGRGIETALVFFVAMLSPVIGFIMLYTFWYTFVADHYQYVASIGLIALAAGGITMAFRRIDQKNPYIKPVLCCALLVALGVLTWRQCAMYENSETLWRATIERNPESLMAHINLGSELSARGDVDEAMEHFQRALEIQPGDAVAAYSLGNALLRKGRLDDAMPLFQRAVKNDPGDLLAHYNYGVALMEKRRVDEAIARYQKALTIDPKYSPAHYNLGIALFQNKQADEAIAHFKQALELQPGFAAAYHNLGIACSSLGRQGEAAEYFKQAVELESNNVAALNKLAWILATSPLDSLRDGAHAVRCAERASWLTGHADPVLLATLAAAYAEAGRFDDAVKTVRKALHLAQVHNLPITDSIKEQLALYKGGAPYRDTGQSNTATQ
ncbi:tetratricopeptide repeat protein [Candidatus Sumerlaeota bacterium]|nr:tetratricopeptide repeat protein [Candidatus Sumerlaeota bacterium]